MRKRTIPVLALVSVSLFLTNLTDAAASGSYLHIEPSADGSTAPVSNNLLNGTASISQTDAWSVGYFSDPTATDHTLTEHWNGTSWTKTSSPDGTSGSQLLGVSAVSSNDAWAVGLQNANLAVTSDATLIEHWNGTAWTIVPSPNASTKGNTLTSVSAISANDVWAAGYFEDDTETQTLPLLEHWDGQRWSIAAEPDVAVPSNFVQGVSAVSTNDVWAVGYQFDPTTFEKENLILHWDGTQWTELPGLNIAPGNAFAGVHAIAANDVWAVGTANGADGAPTTNLTAHWNGTQWTQVSVPDSGPSRNALDSVTALSATDVWAVGGAEAASGFNQTLVEHWNGTAWTIVSSPNQNPQGGNPNFLFSVAASAPGRITAVGTWQSFQQGNPGARTLIVTTSRG